MSMIIWLLLGLGVGLIASKLVSTTGEGTIVDILIGVVGAICGGWLLSAFGVIGETGFNVDTIYNISAAVIGSITLLVIYHAFFRRRML